MLFVVVVVVEEVEEVPSADGVEGALPPDALGVEEGWKSDVFNEPEDRDEADRLFSATTLSDFSKTFHSLIVLSVGVFVHAARLMLACSSTDRDDVAKWIEGHYMHHDHYMTSHDRSSVIKGVFE